VVAQTEVVQAAHHRVRPDHRRGRARGRPVLLECDQYIESALAAFEDTLTLHLQTVQRGRGQRAHRGRPDPGRPEERLGTDLLA